MDFKLSEEQKMIQSLARDFVSEQLKPLERDILGRATDLSDARAFLAPEKESELISKVREMGLWGVGIPKEFGGVGLNTLGVCLVEEEIAQTIVPMNFGDVTPVLFDCSVEQQARFLRPALDGQKRPYLALMEPAGETGIDSMKMKVRKANGNYVLNGTKLSLSRIGNDYFAVVFAADKVADSLTCFLVDKGTPGFSVMESNHRTGWSSQIREPVSLIFDDCVIPRENVLGEEGKAIYLGRKWLPRRRIIRCARRIGIARRLLDEASVQAQSMEMFGQPVHHRIDIRAALADIVVLIHAGRLMVYEAAWKADDGEPVRRETAMVKLYTTQIVRTVADRVSHIFNGPPYIAGLPMEVLCRRALAADVTELTLELQRNIITRDIFKGLRV